MHKQKQDIYKTGLIQEFGRPVLSKGFTLVELIVVITILAILGTIAIMAFSGYSKNARDSARISDIGNMKKTLEFWILQSGTYPEPSNGTGVTFSGGLVWNQGTFGESVFQTIGKLDKKPVDPKYDTEYTYSVTQSKKEYQIGAVLEKEMASNLIIPQTYAATQEATAYVTGNYNGILTIIKEPVTYILTLPSIILADINQTNLGLGISLVYEGKSNIPSSYANKNLTMTGSDLMFDVVEVWSGASLKNISQLEFETMVSNIQTAYSGALFASLPQYTNLAGSTVTSSALSLVKSVIETNTKQELTNVGTTPVFQAVNGACGSANGQTLGDSSSIVGGGACTTGTVSSITGVGPWTWSCNGSNSGTTASCSANKLICNEGETIIDNQCTDPYWSNVVSLNNFDGNLTDQKGNTWSGTPTSYVSGKNGQAVNISETSANITLPSSSINDISTGNFAIEFWAKHNSSGMVNHFCYINKDSSYFSPIAFWFDGSTLYFYSSNNTSSWNVASGLIVANPVANTWHHYAVTRSGNNVYVFYDGSLLHTINFSGSFTYWTAGSTLGPQNGGNGQVIIDDFRFTKGDARYTSNFTPPIQSFPNQ